MNNLRIIEKAFIKAKHFSRINDADLPVIFDRMTVSSTFLFSLYTSDCRATYNNCLIDKYADVTVMTGMILTNNSINYTQEVMPFVHWCDSNHLVLNVTKT